MLFLQNILNIKIMQTLPIHSSITKEKQVIQESVEFYIFEDIKNIIYIRSALFMTYIFVTFILVSIIFSKKKRKGKELMKKHEKKMKDIHATTEHR